MNGHWILSSEAAMETGEVRVVCSKNYLLEKLHFRNLKWGKNKTVIQCLLAENWSEPKIILGQRLEVRIRFWVFPERVTLVRRKKEKRTVCATNIKNGPKILPSICFSVVDL